MYFNQTCFKIFHKIRQSGKKVFDLWQKYVIHETTTNTNNTCGDHVVARYKLCIRLDGFERRRPLYVQIILVPVSFNLLMKVMYFNRTCVNLLTSDTSITQALDTFRESFGTRYCLYAKISLPLRSFMRSSSQVS